MPRETGTKMVSFSPEELDQFRLTFADDLGQAVKERLSGEADILDGLDGDVRAFVEARSKGLGFPAREVLSALLRTQMMVMLNPPQPEAKEAA